MIENSLWEKYRPKNLNDIILLPRIRDLLGGGISKLNSNVIFYGHYGTGKSSLARLLTKGKPLLYRNTSIHTSIDTLREDIQDFVDTMSGIFDEEDGYKYVFLDEFERASEQYQNGLKAFIEEPGCSERVRFIFVTNHIHKVDKGILSRSVKIDFDPMDDEESKFLKVNYKKRLMEVAKKEKIDIEEIDIKRIIAANFPDMRQMIIVLQTIKLTGVVEYKSVMFDTGLKESLYNTLIKSDILGMQKFIMDNFGPERVQDLFNLCGRPLIETLATKNKDIIKTEKLGDIYSLVSEHSMWLNTIKGGDPVVVGTSCLNKISNILKNN